MELSVVRFVVVLLVVTATSPVSAQQPARGDSAETTDSLRNRRPFFLSPIIVTASVAPIRQDRIGFTSAVLQGVDLRTTPVASAAVVLRRLPGFLYYMQGILARLF